MSDSDSDGDYYGPALPPSFKQQQQPDESGASAKGGGIIGPALPPHLQQQRSVSPDVKDEGTKQPSSSQIGPVIPPHLLQQSAASSSSFAAHVEYPDEGEDSDDEDVIGPLPPDHPKALEMAARYENVRQEKEDKQTDDRKLKREEWMLIPPTNKPVTELGLGPRKFLQRHPAAPVKEGEEIDSDEEFERQTRLALDQQIIDEYDKKMEAMIEKTDGGKRKAGSLLAIHQEELKKKKTAETEAKERRPFDRNTDLSVTGLSSSDKKKYIEKSRELDTRFQKGRQKFL